MAILQFYELTESLKNKTIDYLMAADPEEFKDPGQTMNYIKGPIYSDGGGLLTLWEHDTIIGTLGVILRDAQSGGKIYFHHLHVSQGHSNRLIDLMDAAFEFTARFSKCTFLLSLKPNDRALEPFVAGKGFKKTHRALIMTYAKPLEACVRKLKKDLFRFEPISSRLRQTFVDVTNEAFKAVPNSGDIDDREISQILKTYPETLFGICRYDKIPVGTYELLPGKTGWINNIGVTPKHWGKGVGTELVCWSVDQLFGLGADHVKLKVIDTNDRAFQLYQCLGFEIESIASNWFTRKQKAR